ncbi:MAG: hypothetical protein methR_P0046 [Methyloprofundus sp.]|nr:MAG: hypothetical protein methR_P0046 [Methyloprofundus sp.]
MKKPKKTTNNSMPDTNNLVAKHAHYFNKALIFKDKRKYQRKTKHKSFDPFLMACAYIIKKRPKLFQTLPHTATLKNTAIPGSSSA